MPPWFRQFRQYCHLASAGTLQSSESDRPRAEYQPRVFREWLYRYPMFRQRLVALGFAQFGRLFLTVYYCARSPRLCPTALALHALCRVLGLYRLCRSEVFGKIPYHLLGLYYQSIGRLQVLPTLRQCNYRIVV